VSTYNPRLPRRFEHQLSRNLEVHGETDCIGKFEEKHLARALYRLDLATDNRRGTKSLRGKPTLIIKHGEAGHRAPDDRRRKAPSEPFDFRQLRHSTLSLRRGNESATIVRAQVRVRTLRLRKTLRQRDLGNRPRLHHKVVISS
jgi:hypothetical protein